MRNITGLQPSSSEVIPITQTLIERFVHRCSVYIRLTNTSNSVVRDVWIWCCYTHDGLPTERDVLLAAAEIRPYESIAIDAGPFNFADQGSIWARCGTAAAVNIHISKASY